MVPVFQAILLADRVYEDKSGKKIICGTFNKVLLSQDAKVVQDYPTDEKKKIIQGGTDAGCPWIYVSITDVVSEVDIILQFMNVSKNQVLLEIPIKIQCSDRLATVEFAMPLPPLTTLVSEPGTYSVDLLWSGEIVGSHRIVAENIPDPTQGA
jgi:hypothetical protein